MTSVAGVAQRTGATIYYIEMAPSGGHAPVFALMPSAGDVDILIAAELMEAGRALMRGFVTPERTTLIASTHRALAVSEKIVPGDGIADLDAVVEAARVMSKRYLSFDMDRIAVDAGTVISASLFGALAGSGTLPFAREEFEAVIKASGRGVEASLAAFNAACDRAADSSAEKAEIPEAPMQRRMSGPEDAMAGFEQLSARLKDLPAPARDMARCGLENVVDYQDIDYGVEYLDRLEEIAKADRDTGGDGQGCAVTNAAAKHLANAMVYDDIIRVADLKTRSARFDRVRSEVGVTSENLLHVTEFMHPRAQEICGVMPAGLGARIEASPRLFSLLDKMVNRGRRVRTDRVSSYLMLHFLGGLRRWRRKLWRHAQEQAHLEAWLGKAMAALPKDYDLAVERLNCRRLIKGYSDTHARGLSKFDRVMQGSETVEGRDDAADWTRRLIGAALQDEKGDALDGALKTIAEFAE